MSFDRTAALTYLQNKYAALAVAAGQTVTTDSDAGYGPVIDEALLRYGTAYTDLGSPTVADADVLAVRALLRYYALLHFEQRLVSKADFDVVGTSAAITKKQSSALAQVRQLLAEATSQVEAYNYTVTGGGAFTMGSLLLDILEPDPTL